MRVESTSIEGSIKFNSGLNQNWTQSLNQLIQPQSTLIEPSMNLNSRCQSIVNPKPSKCPVSLSIKCDSSLNSNATQSLNQLQFRPQSDLTQSLIRT